MNYSLRQIHSALENLGVLGGEKDEALKQVENAIDALEDALDCMDTLQVVTRGSVDTLLGCMMAVEAIAGVENGK